MASETTPLVSTDSSVNNAPTAYFLDGAHHRRGSSISSSANKGRAASPFPGATAIKEEEELNTAFNKYIARLQSENYKKRLENEKTKQKETT